jgi:dephospho-CoA kinase
MGHLIAVMGMTGAGKSELCDYLQKKGFWFVRFGQITLDLAKQRFGQVNQEREAIIREEIRNQHGMGAYAVMNMPKFLQGLKRGNVVADGLISWEEAEYLQEQLGKRVILLCLVAGTKWRYKRVAERGLPNDEKMRFRPHTAEEARTRDLAQLEKIHQGPSIALAEYYIVNQGTKEELHIAVEDFIEWAKRERGLKL